MGAVEAAMEGAARRRFAELFRLSERELDAIPPAILAKLIEASEDGRARYERLGLDGEAPGA